MTFRQSLEGALRSAWCDLIESSAATYDILSDLVSPFPPARWLETQGNIVRTFCNREPPPRTDLPFSGGQCPVWYRVVFDIRPIGGVWVDPSELRGTANPQRIQGAFLGPLESLSYRETGRDLGASLPRKVITQRWRCRDYRVNWSSDTIAPSTPGILPPVDFRDGNAYAVSPSTVDFAVTFITFSRFTGSDDCGAPPSSFPPPPLPGYNQLQRQVTYTNSNNVNVTVPVGIAFFKAFLSLNGTIQIPITVNINGTVQFPITFDLGNNTFTFDFRPTGAPQLPPTQPPGGGGSRGGPRPDDFTPESPPPPPPPGEEFEDVIPPQEPEEERTIRGVIVTVTSEVPNSLTQVFQLGGNPDLILPDFGQVQFLIRAGGAIAWTDHTRVRNQRAFVPCEWDGGAIDVQGTPRPGVTWELTPILAKADLET